MSWLACSVYFSIINRAHTGREYDAARGPRVSCQFGDVIHYRCTHRDPTSIDRNAAAANRHAHAYDKAQRNPSSGLCDAFLWRIRTG
ncbi:MAG: hypothetical protein ACOYYS_11785 [Chloroflexota bacterium]